MYYKRMKKPNMEKTYDPQKTEDRIYEKWEKTGVFKPEKNSKKESFSIALPPPNATGTLHLGHAVMLAIEDIMTRRARMEGKNALWLPGTDHAAIATENKVEKILIEKNRKTKQELGREKFLKEVDAFVKNSQATIRNQMKKIGASCDWSRERYTLDSGLTRCVQEIFVKMHKDGLIYKGNRIVNWCTRCQSTLADDEVEHKEQQACLYTFKYDKDFPISISTTRPETKLGDTAVAVHPQDKRYKKYIGKTIKADFLGTPLEIKIIADKSIDRKFGTGALGVTPSHSMADAELAKKYSLKMISVITESGKIKRGISKFGDQYVLEARENMVLELKEKGLLEKTEQITNNLSVCYRCSTPIEPLISEQWFVSVDKPSVKWKNKKLSMKQVAKDAVKSSDIEIIPKRFNKIYFQWMDNLHDWCVSRQIWFGHRIPAWYENGNKTKLKVCVEKPGKNWIQDPDTLDTWFSSALWTFSTLLDKPKKTDTFETWIKRNKKPGSDLKSFHPTSVMETGYDILFFWVSRMILSTTYALSEIPFKKIYLHGLVRDKEGKKMSKSLGNGIDPIDMIKKYGADATRLSLVIGTTPGADSKLYEEKIAGYRNFVNKIWNISRFVLTNPKEKPSQKDETLSDKWIRIKMENLITETEKHFNDFEFSQAGEKIYDFLWHDFADWYLEVSKQQQKSVAQEILIKSIKLLHPFTPFVTEEIYSLISKTGLCGEKEKFLCLTKVEKAKKPDAKTTRENKKTEQDFKSFQMLVSSIRDLRTSRNLGFSETINAVIETKKHKAMFQKMETVTEFLTKTKIQVLPSAQAESEDYIKADFENFSVYLKINQKTSAIEKEKRDKEKLSIENYIATLEKKLSNKAFLENAPKEIVDQTKEKLLKAKAMFEKM